MNTASVPTALRIDRSLFAEVVRHLADAAPLEGVGLLAVEVDGAAVRATRFYPGTNVDRSPSRYTMEPGEVLAAFRDIDANGWRFGVIVHSHPATAPEPSPTDLREAYYPEALLLIVGLGRGTPEARVWRLLRSASETATAVVEVPLVVEDRAAEVGTWPGGDQEPGVAEGSVMTSESPTTWPTGPR